MRSPRTFRSSAAPRACNALIAAVVAVSMVIQLALLFTGGADANSNDSGTSVSTATRLIRLFSYFTIESNLIVLAVAITLVVWPDRDGPVWRIARLDALLGIVITGLVFAIVLAPQLHLTGAALVATIGFHYVSPWATLLVWILYGPRPRVTKRTIGWAFAWPLAWIAYTFVHGAATDWYPYPFLDAADKGYPRAVFATAIVLVIALVLAVGFALADPLPTMRSAASDELDAAEADR